MLFGKKESEYYFFSGKGGVGKTSIAAATAIWFSNKGKKTLIISTDPAHSLSDSFETQVGSDIKKISKNLFAVEIDPKKSMAEYKEKMSPGIEKIGMLKGLGIEDMFDTAGMTPGIDEISAFDKFLQYMGSNDYDIVIFDTAPTGHTLRLLSLPDVLDSWIGKMIKIRMKFSGVINTFKKIMPFGNDEKEEQKLGTDFFEEMKARISTAREILSNPERTHYRIVLIPEDMSILESERSLKVLDDYKISTDAVVINQIMPENPECKFCSEKRNQQEKRIEVINNKFGELKIMQLPLFSKEIKGMEALKETAKILYEK